MCLCDRPCDALVQAIDEGMDLAWAEGVVDGLGASDVAVELAPEPGRCCVIFHPRPDAGVPESL